MPSVSIYQNTGGGAVPDIFVILLHHAHSINMTLLHRIGEAQTDCQHTII